LIVIVLGQEAGFDQFVTAIEVRLRVVQRGDVALRLRLGLVERRAIVALVDLVDQLALLHIGAIGNRLRLDVAGNLGL
jgi:hypothetical protein